MEIFIDSASLGEIERAVGLGVVDGVTTNPSLIASEVSKGEAADIEAHYHRICDLVKDKVSAEVTAEGDDYTGMVEQGRGLSSINEKIVVKVPMTWAGLRAIKTLTAEGIRTNCTLIFNTTQAVLAAKAGATYVSPFVGRLDDMAIPGGGMQFIQQLVEAFSNYSFETRILAASVRTPMHFSECLQLGVDTVTCGLSLLKTLVKHPLTSAGLARFLSDHKKAMEKQS